MKIKLYLRYSLFSYTLGTVTYKLLLVRFHTQIIPVPHLSSLFQCHSPNTLYPVLSFQSKRSSQFLLPLNMIFLFLQIPHMRDYSVPVPLLLTDFIQHDALQIHPDSRKFHDLIFSYRQASQCVLVLATTTAA